MVEYPVDKVFKIYTDHQERKFIYDFWGHGEYTISKNDIEHLLNGGKLGLTNDEYSHVIKLEATKGK